MPKQTKRNANSVPPASPGGQSTAAAAVDTTQPISALADALVKNFGSQFADVVDTNTRSQGGNEPPQDAVPPEPGAEVTEETAGADRQPAEVAPETPLEETGTEPAGTTGDLSQTQDEPAAGAEPQPAAAEPTDGPGVKKRIGDLLNKVKRLEKQLEQRAAPGAAPETASQPTEIDGISDPGILAEREVKLESAVEECDELLTRLQHNPQRVEQWLRANQVKLTDEAGNEDYSPERVAEFLSRTRQGFRSALRAIPRRRQYLAEFTTAHQQTVAVKPWIGNEEDPRFEMMQQIVHQFPGIKQRPNWEYWLACSIEGHLATQAQLRARNGGRATGTPRPAGAAAAARPGPGTATPGAPAPRVRPDQAKVDAAKKKVLKQGDRAALSEFFEATGFAGQ